ncbi:efflux RND transporter periplasmic adaptor subunit [Coxiella burnetii]|uniref:efflux RND transporter periplasmic adaptor subunit n=1 Tax=Coxiella burnetii TaxID=777 RepID=UPI000163A398|nr:efflux RND transporter periplasmic adaptor subunit [Coxiella burnetii]AIT63233.1 RND family efflux transporter MFP subunit [Coxiella burnetii str. Namibia]ATN85827.1 efflux transporter periplasmic adaptor subunit [Coxiella burnetii str. Schperling]EDR35748.1 efflux transporter, RND family, MFP subunit [Coxiella burnetii Q321]PHH56656.1 MexH family multidrug efflux RND transporter periplasmic adaptor subunit [Coxiella burnetii]UYK68906.1 efflux RND transporter periplasmic adaptor subunit [Co
MAKSKGRLIGAIVVSSLIFILALVMAFDALRAYLIKKGVQEFVPPPVTISTTKALSESWQPVLTAVGSLSAIQGVNISPEVSGRVIAIRFTSGQLVKSGESLIQLDDSSDVQDLKNNQAALNLARVDFERKAALYKTGAIARSDYDQALAQLQQTEAQVNKSLVAISKKNIRAPFSGKIGIRQVNLGQYVNPGDALVSLQSLDPLYVNFSLPEQFLKDLSLNQKLSITVDSYPEEKFEGKITALDSLVTEATRNINVQGTIPNGDYRLYPGTFANVTVYLPEKKAVVTVPQTAVTYSLYGDTVFVVEPGKNKKGQAALVARQRLVEIGDMKNNKVFIKKGVKAGEEVVTSGQNKLHEGTTVKIDNSVVLKPANRETLTGS